MNSATSSTYVLPRRMLSLGVVVLVHVVVGYALVSGLARKAIDMVQSPVQVTLIHDVIPEPPPPPPPVTKVVEKLETAQAQPTPAVLEAKPEVAPPIESVPTVAAVTKEQPTMVPEPVAPQPIVKAAPEPAHVAPKQLAMGIACPKQVAPEMPERALREGISGVVRAQVRVHDGRVREVQILSGPKLFHEAVRKAMLQYGCNTIGDAEVVAVQELRFDIE